MRGLPKFPKNFPWKFPFHLSFSPEFSVEWFPFRKFSDFWGAFHSIKNSRINYRKFPLVNGTEFSGVENYKPHSFVRLEFFNDFEKQTEH